MVTIMIVVIKMVLTAKMMVIVVVVAIVTMVMATGVGNVMMWRYDDYDVNDDNLHMEEFEALPSGYSVLALLLMSMLDGTIPQPRISTQYKATLVH
jgi:hypothetical protein